MLYSDFLEFVPKVLFLLQDPTQDTSFHLVIMSPWAPSGCICFSDFLCFWWLWGGPVTNFAECSLTGISLTVFSGLGWVMHLEEEVHKDKCIPVAFIQGTCYQHDLSLLRLTLITWPRQCLPGFSTRKWLFPSFSCGTLWKDVIMLSPHVSLGICSTFLKVKRLHKLSGILLHRILSKASIRLCQVLDWSTLMTSQLS